MRHGLRLHRQDPRRGLIYAVNPFGADHQSSEHNPGYAPDSDEESLRRLALLGLTDPQDPMNLSDEKVRFALITQQFYSLLDSASVCQFVYGPAWQLYGPDHLSDALNAATGWNTSVDELVDVGARKLTMQRLFNAREDAGRNEDKLPKKLFKPLAGGPSDGLHVTEERWSRRWIATDSTGPQPHRERTRCRIPVGAICRLERPHRNKGGASLLRAVSTLFLVPTAA